MAQSASVLSRALGIGAVAGMRTFMAPVLVSRALRRAAGGACSLEPAHTLCSSTAARALALLAAGELVVDKLPITPNRTLLPSLAGRVLSGALAGAAVAAVQRESTRPAALVGALAAFGSAHALLRLRTEMGRRLDVPDPIIGLAEDALAVGLGTAVLHERAEPHRSREEGRRW